MPRLFPVYRVIFVNQRSRPDNESGIILVVVLWILVILTIMAVGMGRRGQTDMALARYVIGQTRAKYIAWAGIRYAAARISQDSDDAESAMVDTFASCGVSLGKGESLASLFRRVPVSGGYFTIVPSLADKAAGKRYGMSDESARINLNALTPVNYRVLKFLLIGRGCSDELAETISSSAVDWIDADSTVFNEPYGNEERNPPEGQAAVKNRSFESVQELLLIRGMTSEIFSGIQHDVTAVPKTGMVINCDTASPEVIRAHARHFSGPQTNTLIADADALVEKILAWRRGADRMAGTDDDRVVEGNELGLNAKENSIFFMMEGSRTRVASLLRLGVIGVDEETGAVYQAEAVISRSGGDVVYWHRM